ncbi:related to ring finger protein 11 [Rhynchosporium agropyri]|uniref:Related to ring finger protein 11 n=1 Tax=Rhynchosporium agropyri TaxID=914238 RepID=A0A1E1KM10_9HELO|nr:related to ring finger protein 11 [Rhynchosporium agropyri]
MAVLNQIMVEALHIVERQITNGENSTVAQPTPLMQPTTQPTTTPTPTMSPSNNNNNNNNGPTSSPLLFFVALGFGVVFTNLWIIVGVKYCFRYNARNRAIRNGEDPDPINMENMPARPHRRRREKKLMTMEEVNDRFPLTKYKSWVASRAREGLSTTGGVTAPPSRPGSVRGVDGVIPSSPAGTKHSVNTRPDTAASDREVAISSKNNFGADVKSVDAIVAEKGFESQTVEEQNRLEQVNTTTGTIDKHRTTNSDDDEDDDHIHTAVPPELLTNPGDSCAICIDTLEDDDDIRGLTCGHAFHAGCLDPWLTSRRACCPLCKADYYTPKPRPEGEAVEPDRTGRRRQNNPQQPQPVFFSMRGNRLLFPARFGMRAPAPTSGAEGAGNPNTSRVGHRSRRQAAAAQTTSTSPVQSDQGGNLNGQQASTRRWNPFSNITMPAMRLPRRNQQVPTEVSPSQLEAGNAR